MTQPKVVTGNGQLSFYFQQITTPGLEFEALFRKLRELLLPIISRQNICMVGNLFAQ